jgi:hypothetical protein
VVLVANHWQCPLTRVAAQYTADRRDHFDLCLPAWLARTTNRFLLLYL